MVLEFPTNSRHLPDELEGLLSRFLAVSNLKRTRFLVTKSNTTTCPAPHEYLSRCRMIPSLTTGLSSTLEKFEVTVSVKEKLARLVNDPSELDNSNENYASQKLLPKNAIASLQVFFRESYLERKRR